MIFYPGETHDELRERLAFFSLVTPAACDFLLEAAGELGDTESVKRACDIAITLLDPARVINSCGSDCLDYFNALALCPSVSDAEIAAELGHLEKQSARGKWCTLFWVYHARGDEVSAAYAYEKWLECPRKPDHRSRLFAYELMMLCAMGAHEEAFAYAGCDNAFPTLEDLVHAFNCYDHEHGMVYAALIEGYACTGQFDAALNWALYSLVGRRRDGVFHQYGVIQRILPLLPKEFQAYIRAAAYALDRAGLVAHDQLSIVREIHGGVDTVLPPLASDVQLSDFSRTIVDALWFLTNTSARDAHFTSPDQFPCLPAANFLLAQVAAVRVKETTGTLRHTWLTKACEFSDETPEFAWALAHWCWDKASDDERETLLEDLPGAFADLAMIDVGVYEQVKQWITQQGEKAEKLNPARASVIRAQILFQLGRHATYCSRWWEALDYINQSIEAHQNPTWMPKLQQLLSLNPRLEQPEPTLADSRAQHEATQLWEQVYHARKPELGDAFRRWIALCRTYSGFTPRVLQVTYLVEYFWLYIWTLCEDPHATATDFQQALDDYESIMIAHYHFAVAAEDEATVAMYEEESISQRMAFARTMFAHRLSDHELVSQQRRIWRAEESYDERFLGEHELVYLLDSCTQTGDFCRGRR